MTDKRQCAMVRLLTDSYPYLSLFSRYDTIYPNCYLYFDALLIPIIAVKSGRTALHEAAKEGHAEVCRYLLKQGAHVNATDNVR